MGVGVAQSKGPLPSKKRLQAYSKGPRKCTADGGLLSSHVEYGPEAGWAGVQLYGWESKAQKNERDFFMFHSKKTAWVRVALRSPLDMSQLHAYRQSQSVG